MGKAMRLKGDLDDIGAILEIISVLKDVSTNKFFAFAQRKASYQKFFESFFRFFEMMGNVETFCPLVKNANKGVDIVVITSEQSFMSQLNGRVSSAALAEYNKNPGSSLICIGNRGAEKCRSLGMNIQTTFPANAGDSYELAVQIRDLLIERIMSGKTGKAVIVYLWAKSFSILKPRVITLLPASELLEDEKDLEGEEAVKKRIERQKKRRDFIQETNFDVIMMALADIWVHARLYEVVNDLEIVESAAQAQQLESAIEGMGSEKKSLTVSFRKAGRDELNGAMREVFTQTSMMKAKSRRR